MLCEIFAERSKGPILVTYPNKELENSETKEMEKTHDIKKQCSHWHWNGSPPLLRHDPTAQQAPAVLKSEP